MNKLNLAGITQNKNSNTDKEMTVENSQKPTTNNGAPLLGKKGFSLDISKAVKNKEQEDNG